MGVDTRIDRTGPARQTGTSITAAATQYVLAYAVALPVFLVHGAVRRARRRLDARPR